MIVAKDIYKQFGQLQVLNGVSFEVNAGEVVSIIGPSGSGKSTMLRCLNRLEEVDAGTIIVDGEILCQNVDGIVKYSSKDTLKSISRKMGMVFQQFNLFPHFSVKRNVSEALVRVLKMDSKDADAKAMEALEKTGLSDKADAYPYQLSGGQQQRVAISRALAMNPQYLCFDEPTSSLDPELTVEVLNVMRNLAAEGNTTMVVVTHEMEFARDVSDRVIFMEKGAIIANDTPDEIFNKDSNDRIKHFVSMF